MSRSTALESALGSRRHVDGGAISVTEAGTTVRVFAPTALDLAAMGTDPMDARRRAEVFETAVRTGGSRLFLPDA